MATKTITITTVVDVVGALASDNLSGNFYALDSNKIQGSTGLGTEHLKTMVNLGDRLVWTTMAMECEAYVAIDAINIDSQFCEPEKHIYPGTDISYWVGAVKKNTDSIPYSIKFRLGSLPDAISSAATLALIGQAATPESTNDTSTT